MRIVPTEYIPENAVLADTLYTLDGRILLKEGATLTPRMVEKINANSLFTVYIYDEHNDNKIKKLVDPQLRHQAMMLIKDIFNAAGFRDTQGEWKPKSVYPYMEPLKKITEEILYDLSGSKDAQLEAIDIKNVDNYLYSSAINTAILSVLIGWEAGLNTEMIHQLFIGAIFHDIGMALLEPGIIYKNGELTREEKLEVIMHPKKGYEYLKEQSFLSAYAKAIALQHHEHLDGTGYPNRVDKTGIHQLAQIVGIADIYDAMTSDRPYRRALTAIEAIEYIMGGAQRHYDMNLINIFVKKINPYPAGSLVKLNTGQIAVVDAVPKGFPLRPDIRIIGGQKGAYTYDAVSLREKNSLTIQEIQYSLDF